MSLSVVGFLQPVAAAFLVVTTGYNALLTVNSDEGLIVAERLEADIAARRDHLAALQSQKTALEERTDRLREDRLDKDLLDEKVRSVLGLARPDEYLVRMEDLDRLAALATDEEAAPLPEDPLTRLAALSLAAATVR
ncbi:FtsB family cell division protein [Parvularcula bermudensis]|uniref:FtsB family cell division protein n=1 Tax=Parvularcula bermudensis TaxID=208216 RepID=UPI0003260231|nr:septum formation initiator family protein [Parvularcula bermudensis]